MVVDSRARSLLIVIRLKMLSLMSAHPSLCLAEERLAVGAVSFSPVSHVLYSVASPGCPFPMLFPLLPAGNMIVKFFVFCDGKSTTVTRI